MSGGAGASDRPLAGRTALVTGAVGGLGRPIARRFAAAGAAVAVHHLGDPDSAGDLVAELRNAGARAVAAEADVTQWSEVAAMAELILGELGPVDVLVNNAGFMEAAPFRETTLDHWRRTIDIDLTGVFICCRILVEQMLSVGSGSIVNVASQLAFKGAGDFVAYSAAKAGVVGLTRALARELGPTIRVNAIAPGPVATPLIEPYLTPEWVGERTRDSVIRRLAQPEEVAPAAVFLASDAGALLHGQTIHLNGGGVMA